MLNANMFNEGIGGANIVKQFAIYNHSTRGKQSNLILLLLYRSNDILDSNCKFLDRKAELLGLETKEICATQTQHGASIRPAKSSTDLAPEIYPRAAKSLRERIKLWCRSCDMVHNLVRQVGYGNAGDMNFVTGEQVNLPPSPLEGAIKSEVQDAWLIMKEMLVKFRDQVNADGARFVAVLVPNHSQISPTWKSEYKSHFGQEPPTGYDPAWHEQQLLELTRALDVPTIALSEQFRCDGHWNPVGHFLAASVVAEFLAAKQFIAIENNESFIAARQAERKRSARNILGDLAYGQIYGRGIYRPAN